MVNFFRRIGASLVCLIWMGSNVPANANDQAAAAAPAGHAAVLAGFLDADGGLKLPPGYSGSLDPTGYRLVMGADGQPRFSAEAAVGGADKLFGVLDGCNGEINAIAVAPSGLVYLGGHFTACDDAPASMIVAFKPQTGRFQALGRGAGNGVNSTVYALAVSGSDLYVAGSFTQAGDQPANSIARWNGSSWSSLGTGLVPGANSYINALAVSGGDLYVGGRFTQIGGQPANNIARWNGGTWSPLGTATVNGVARDGGLASVNSLAISGSDLYVGGAFTEAGGQPANRIARWDGTRWSSVGTGAANGIGAGASVNAIAMMGGDLYAGGQFTQAGGQPANNLARWNGSVWSPLGDGVPLGSLSYVSDIAVSGSDLYVGGEFTAAGGQPANNIARWDGSQWSSLGTGAGNGVNHAVRALAASGGDLYVGGFFRQAGTQPANYIARWNGSWSSLGGAKDNGVAGLIYALAVFAGDLHVGGQFAEVGGQPTNAIARWNGSRWSTLGTGLSNGLNGVEVRAFAISGGALYVGGRFNEAGGQPANNVARWNGSSWSSLGTGVGDEFSGVVRALAVIGGDLYAGGRFFEAGGEPVRCVARWNGSSWSALSTGLGQAINDCVYALAVSGSDLYVGGHFSQAGGQPANGIARWNGSSWSPLGSGAENGVYGLVTALAVSGGDLYVGGPFIRAGGLPAGQIARWDGSNWSTLRTGVYGTPEALAVFGGDLYVAGDFAYVDGQPANGLARWNGSAWQGLNNGGPPEVIRALAADSTSLFAGDSGLTQTPLPDLLGKAPSGVLANAASHRVVVSRTGQRIGFASFASNLVAGDSDTLSDVFVSDRTSGAISRASAAAEAINGGAQESFTDPALSADGARAAFSGSSGQVYAVVDGVGRVLSRSAAGALGNGPSGKVHLPGTGNRAWFESQASNLLNSADGNGSLADIFMSDLNTGAVTLISRGPNGEFANGASERPWASDDGQAVAFSTLATNLLMATPAVPAGTRQAVMFREGGSSRLYLSRNPTTGQLGNGHSINVRLTPDGRSGVFESVASNLVDGDTNSASDIFHFEVENNTLTRLTRVSTSSFGFQGNGASRNASISDDGMYVTFETDASNLVGLDRNAANDVLLKWLATGEVVRLSRTVDGNQPNGDSVEPSISGDGSTIVFGSAATNLTQSDNNNVADVYSVAAREPLPAATVDEPALTRFALPAPDPANANCPSGYFSALVDDGAGTGLVPGLFGVEVLLDEPGTRVLAGGLNFGGLFDLSQVGFAGFNIANPEGELQRLNLSLTGSPANSTNGSIPVQIRIARRTATSRTTVFETTQTISLAAAYTASIDLPPAFYEATVGPTSGSAGGAPEGQFFFSLTTRFIDRPGGGFQGGAVVGGYHAAHPFGGVSGFAGFCLATPHTTTIRVLSQPSYGPEGARDLRLRIQDARQRDVVIVPAG